MRYLIGLVIVLLTIATGIVFGYVGIPILETLPFIAFYATIAAFVIEPIA